MTKALLNSIGKVEDLKEVLNIKDKGSAIKWITFLTTVIGIESSPEDDLF